ncbi:MAG: type II toxin-antitoxin system ParD family antitoxin [Neorhizobium sp.]|nr:type II toxin-antitoxin system ParD family antitoxin [Neorhizobium sp.]
MTDDIGEHDGRDGSATIALDSHFARFIERQVTSGQYETANDVVQAGLRLLEEHQHKVAALEAALIEGELSGAAEPFDNDDFVKRMQQKHGR